MESLLVRRVNTFAQLFFWLFFTLIVMLIGISLTTWNRALWLLLSEVIMAAVVVYGSYYGLFPQFLKQRNYWRLGTGILLLLGIGLLLSFGVHLMHEDRLNDKPEWIRYMVRFVVVCILLGGTMVYRMAEEWLKNQELESHQRQQQLETELRFLRSQINPHFLFNTLNNIYSLSYRGHQNATPMIAKLSEIMRYMLYDCGAGRVPLQKEIQLIESYIEMQQLGSGEGLNVDFYHEGVQPGQQIAPMLLINFVENSFKHSGIYNRAEAWINISLEATEKKLIFRVENNSERQSPPNSKSIGNINTLRQLELNYQGRYEIKVQQESEIYTMNLCLPLG